jgi:hypothetical protein
MKEKFFRHALRIIPIGSLILMGCSGEPAKPTAPTISPAAVAPPATARRAPKEILDAAAAKAPAPFEGEGWQPMFDGKTLAGWRETDFAGHGEVECQSGMILLNTGDPFTGINWTNEFPKMNYEIALDAIRVTGSDFFCGLTVPVQESFCSLIVGGWGGSLLGISSLDGMDASENETGKFMNFEQGRWYRIRMRVTETKITVWVDNDKLIDVATTDRKISLRPGDIEMSKPMGISAWTTTAALRQIQVRRL